MRPCLPDAAAWALCVGADFINAARAVKQAMGCVMSHECDRDTCVAGITTHNEELQKALDPAIKSINVANYIKGIRNELEVLAHSCGLSEPRDFRPYHLNEVQKDGHPKPLSEIYPNLKFDDKPPPSLKI